MALGVPGPTGATGATGANGQGVAAGGTTGQALVKSSNADYATTWATITSGGGTWGSITGTLSSQTDLQNALNAKLSTSAAASTYQTQAGMSAFLSTSAAASTYIPFTSSGTNSISRTTKAPNEDETGIFTVGGYENPGVSLGAFVKLTNLIGAGEISFVADEVDGTFLKFSDASKQYTAFPPSGGTTSQYIRGNGSLATFPAVGDRYLTTSTTSLSIGNGTKTLTIGTGLSYTTQQDVTIAYDASNHMHATVTSYNSGTGVMVADVHKHSGSGTFAAWTINVGGVVGGLYLAVSNNLSELTATASTARTNLGLGTMSTEPASAYLSTASAVANYLTISNAASTYLTQSSASSTYIAQASFATSTQAQAGTSTTTVISPSTLLDAKVFAGYKPLSLVYTWTSAVSGSGATTTANGQSKNVFAPTSATGSAIVYIFNYASSRGQQSASGADFTKRTTIGGRFIKTTTTADANSVFRFLLGKAIPSPAAGDLASRGIGFRQVSNGALELQVHNGTTLYNVTSSFTPTANQSYDVVIVADAGTATMFVNGSSVATSANAPTALLGTNTGILEVETQNTSTLSGSAMNYACSDMFVQTNL
jgi:hypothetical protein